MAAWWSCVDEEEIDVVLATDEECALSTDSSRVSLFTIASCSFSSSRCISAGVIGRGCLIGTPATVVSLGLKGGNGICPCCTLAGIVPPGEAKGSGGGFIG